MEVVKVEEMVVVTKVVVAPAVAMEVAWVAVTVVVTARAVPREVKAAKAVAMMAAVVTEGSPECDVRQR